MGFFTGSTKYNPNPFAQPYIDKLGGFADDVSGGIGMKSSKGIIKQMMSGDYSGLAGGILSPIHDRFATNYREQLRNNMMGANKMAYGWQPQLMKATEDVTRRQNAQDEGLAYGQAIPELYGQAAGIYQNAKNSRDQLRLNALQSAMQGSISGTQSQYNPSTWEKITGFVGGLGGMMSAI